MNGGSFIIDGLLAYSFYYPLFMSGMWMLGGIYYYFHWERNGDSRGGVRPVPELDHYPFVSIIVPCHNEIRNIRETLASLRDQDYPNYEIIAVDDGSVDGTPAILDEIAAGCARLRVVHLESNQGKAMALRTGSLVARGEYLVTIDGDALLDPRATTWLISHFIKSPRVGAVTGNPRIRNRSTLLGKVQVGEFSSIIGLIKRAQRIYGRIFTVSGVIAAFRKAALHRAGYWSTDTLTDDIDISWKLQIDHWDIRFEPNALAWILMPETLHGLWRQRLRWAMGGVEAMSRYAGALPYWRKRRFWGVALEFCTSTVWAYTMLTVIVLFLVGLVVELPEMIRINSITPEWHGVLLALVCLIQFGVSMFIDRRYEVGLGRQYYWMIWYPLGFWLITMVTTVTAVPAVMMRRRRNGLWISPDRGIHQREVEDG